MMSENKMAIFASPSLSAMYWQLRNNGLCDYVAVLRTLEKKDAA